MTKLRKQRKQLKRKEKILEKNLAHAVARLESLDDDMVNANKIRKQLKRRKNADKTYDAEELKTVNAEVRKINADRAEVRGNIGERKSWLKSIRKAIAKKTKAIKKQDEPKVIDLKLNFRAMTTQSYVDKVIGHYTAGPVDADTKDAIKWCKLYHQAHLNQGWSGEAYMLCFTRDGNILLLRPAKYVGAHTLGYNTGSYGIMMHGTTGDKPTQAQKDALRWWAKNGHKNVMGKCKTEVAPEKYDWYGHNDFNATGCPGDFKTAYTSKGKK